MTRKLPTIAATLITDISDINKVDTAREQFCPWLLVTLELFMVNFSCMKDTLLSGLQWTLPSMMFYQQEQLKETPRSLYLANLLQCMFPLAIWLICYFPVSFQACLSLFHLCRLTISGDENLTCSPFAPLNCYKFSVRNAFMNLEAFSVNLNSLSFLKLK